MAYRRKQQQQQGGSSEFDDPETRSSLAAKAIRASSVHRDSSLSSAYSNPAISPRNPAISPRNSDLSTNLKSSTKHEYAPLKTLEPKQGFWGVLARKAKAIIDDGDNDDDAPHVVSPRITRLQMPDSPRRTKLQMPDTPTRGQYNNSYAPENHRKTDSPRLKKGLDAFTSSLSNIGGTISNALEEGLNRVENRQIRKKTSSLEKHNQTSGTSPQPQTQPYVQPQIQTDLGTQLKASRDVAMAMAAKAKLLLRELKTIKADLAFAKERCAQLEEENRILRESHEKGDNPEDDDLIRLQLETLLAEKARLAQENSVFARENRFLREIVEYHQLTMQDVVYLDEGSEQVTEVYPFKVPQTPEVSSTVDPWS